MYPALLLIALQVPTDTAPAFRPDSADLATAYANAETRELVRLARRHQGMFDDAVTRYRATRRLRISAGIQALRRDRMLFRRETASIVDWHRDGVTRIEVKGAREVVPVAFAGVRVVEDLEDIADMIPEPGGDRLFLTPDGDGFAWHPLVEGGEAAYRYAIGDTTVIRLPDGEPIRLVELRVNPRRRDIRLISGSFWLELGQHAIVQAVYRPARDFDFERDIATLDPDEDPDDVPEWLKPIRFDLRYITVDYGLWDQRWWMPRLVAAEGHLQLGAIRLPVSYQLAFSDYEIEADPTGLPPLPPVIRDLAGDTTIEPRPYERPVAFTFADTAELLSSALLPPSIYEEGIELITRGEIEDLARRLEALPPPPWQPARPRVTWPWERPTLVRYNRVEGPSAGARLDWDLGRVQLDLVARMGGDLVPRAELGVELPGQRTAWRLAGYHRLAPADPSVRPFSLGNSLNALVLGRDDGVYFQASGAEAMLRPSTGGPYELRVYAERQAAAPIWTHFSVRRLLSSDHEFNDNIAAATAHQVGVAVRAGGERGLDPTGFRWGGWIDVRAETGDWTFVRPGLTLRLAAPILPRLLAAVEVAGGTTAGADQNEAGAAPVQSRWFVGGPATLRGYPGGHASGENYARARVELATAFPAARVALFWDAGRAWSTDIEQDTGHAVGVGASVLDGLLRVDLARRLTQPDDGWRLELYVDALF